MKVYLHSLFISNSEKKKTLISNIHYSNTPLRDRQWRTACLALKCLQHGGHITALDFLILSLKKRNMNGSNFIHSATH